MALNVVVVIDLLPALIRKKAKKKVPKNGKTNQQGRKSRSSKHSRGKAETEVHTQLKYFFVVCW